MTDAGGSFELAVLPVPGHLAVQAPSDDYVLREMGNREFFNGTRGGSRLYSHCFVAGEAKPGGSVLEVRVALRRGVTLTGAIIGPDNRPVDDVWIIARTLLRSTPVAWRGWTGVFHGVAIRGRFELHGLDPETEHSIYFLQPKRRIGAKVVVSGKLVAGHPMTVRLEPCGMARARLVDAQGEPIAGYGTPSMISMIVTPGPDRLPRNPAAAMPLLGEEDRLFVIDPINYAKAPRPTPGAGSSSLL